MWCELGPAGVAPRWAGAPMSWRPAFLTSPSDHAFEHAGPGRARPDAGPPGGRIPRRARSRSRRRAAEGGAMRVGMMLGSTFSLASLVRINRSLFLGLEGTERVYLPD